jgi:hypothetical protein
MRKIKKKMGLFAWLPERNEQGLVCEIGETAVHKVFHFSYGRVYKQIPEIKLLIDSVCENF